MFLTANGNPCDERPASRVRHNHFPKWFSKRIRMACTSDGESSDELNLLYKLARSTCDNAIWFDHVGSALHDNRQVFVSEPYLRPQDDFTCARLVAALLGCDLVVLEQSYWFPGKTIRLVFTPKTDQ